LVREGEREMRKQERKDEERGMIDQSTIELETVAEHWFSYYKLYTICWYKTTLIEFNLSLSISLSLFFSISIRYFLSYMIVFEILTLIFLYSHFMFMAILRKDVE
jgi:hypothetical protein